MTIFKALGGVAATVACLAAVMMPTVVMAQAGAADGWVAITQCASIADDAARHTCLDDVLRRAGLLSRKSFGLETSPAHQPAPVPSDASVAAAAQAKREHDEPLQVTLAEVTAGGDGKLALTTTDGAVWRQVESAAVRPTPTRGQAMTIERTSFGGFMCKPGKWVAFRCYRAR